MSKEKRLIKAKKATITKIKNGTTPKDKKHSEYTKNKMSKSHKGMHSGSKNNRAVKYFIFSPQGINYFINGELNIFCNENFLNVNIMHKNINKGIIEPWNFYKNTTQQAKNCVGWEIHKIS